MTVRSLGLPSRVSFSMRRRDLSARGAAGASLMRTSLFAAAAPGSIGRARVDGGDQLAARLERACRPRRGRRSRPCRWAGAGSGSNPSWTLNVSARPAAGEHRAGVVGEAGRRFGSGAIRRSGPTGGDLGGDGDQPLGRHPSAR